MHTVEADIEKHFMDAVSAGGGITERIQYRGKRGCADHLTAFPFNRLYLVELKRPNDRGGAMGGRVSKLQEIDEKRWAQVGVQKVYLWTFEMVNRWVKRVSCG